MKLNKHSLDILMRLNLYILPLFLLLLSSFAFKDGNTISGYVSGQSSFVASSSFSGYSEVSLSYFQGSNDLDTWLSTNGEFISFEDGRYVPYLITASIPILDAFDISYIYKYCVYYRMDFSPSRYFVFPYSLSIGENLLLSCDTVEVSNIVQYTVSDISFTSNSVSDIDIEYLNIYTLLGSTSLFYGTFLSGDYGPSGAFLDLNSQFLLNTTDDDNIDLLEIVSSIPTPTYQVLDYPNFNVEFNNIMKPILDLPLASDFYTWTKTYFIQGDYYIIENVFAWVFYLVFVEFAILIKNVLVFIFYWANKMIERGLKYD